MGDTLDPVVLNSFSRTASLERRFTDSRFNPESVGVETLVSPVSKLVTILVLIELVRRSTAISEVSPAILIFTLIDPREF